MNHYYITYCFTDKNRKVSKAHIFVAIDHIFNGDDETNIIVKLKTENDYRRVVIDNICYLGSEIAVDTGDASYKLF